MDDAERIERPGWTSSPEYAAMAKRLQEWSYRQAQRRQEESDRVSAMLMRPTVTAPRLSPEKFRRLGR